MVEVMGYNKNNLDRQKEDFYATPINEVVNILHYENIEGNILDNCCGEGNICKGILKVYPDKQIIATDLIDRGYGLGGLDFLNLDYQFINNIDNIIINPPFKLLEQFIIKSLSIINNKLLVFARFQLAESESRFNSIFKNNPPTKIYLYVDRVACAKNGDFKNAGSSSMAFAWFVWDKKENIKETSFKWLRRYDKN